MEYGTQAELLRAVESFTSMGWEVLPADNPERASVGFVAFRVTPPTVAGGKVQEVVEHLDWFPLGHVETVTYMARRDEDLQAWSATFRQIATEGIEVFKADDPKARLLGLVAYRDGKAHVFRVALTLMKGNMSSIGLTPYYERWQKASQLRSRYF